MKKNQKAILLMIADGANVATTAVKFFQAAHSADVVISQFHYLEKLLLIHGAWSYQQLVICSF
jgi:phospholipid-transporting ATPase